MNVGSVVQIGGAVKHSPLHSLFNFVHNDDDDEENPHASKETEKSVIGGFIGEGYLAWRASGATIEVTDSQTCIQQAAWTFGAMLHYTSPAITCVCGIGVGPVTHIVIGVDLGSEQIPRGMVGVLSLRRSRIIRAFRFQHKVTNVCMITGGEKVVDPSTLTPELRSCQGLLAVATSHSSLYLVDLALDLGDEITSDEMSPAHLIDISIPDSQTELKRNKIVSSHSHPILCLSDNMHLGKTFRLLGPDDHILYEASSHSVNITSLMYIPQVASLVVGYSFGSFQLINLNLITIDCASPYEENIPPVFSFAYQEPENDPRSFVYLWVCRSHSSDSDSSSENYSLERSTCSLYSMHYEKKEWIEGHGLWYQSLLSMSPRFNFSAIGGIGEKIYSSSPSKMISAMSIMGTTPSFNLLSGSLNGMTDDALSLSDDEAEPVPELSLCLFCWESSVLSQGKVIIQHYIAIFDINQWYQAQMPSQLRLEENELCAYMSFHILDKVPSSFSEALLGGMPLRGSWARHSSRTHCEKMWYPSALSYDFNLLTSESLATYHCPSVQQSTISCLLQQGPGAVVNPNNAFKMCVFSGILSNIDAVMNGASTLVNEREQILNTALEYHLLPLLSQCVIEFNEGRFSHLGCSPQLLLDWGWNKLKEVKNSTDSLCGPILSFPVEDIVSLSTQNLIILHQNLTYLSHLSSIFSQIRDNSGEVTTLSAKELEGRVQIVNLLKLHLQIVLWFYHCGLLPQYSPEEALDDHAVPFPVHALHNIYEKRRKEVEDVTGSTFLLIDSIMDECGKLLPEIWNIEKERESHLYPPLSLHNIISMYLLPGISTFTKHRIVQFLLLDLSSILSENFSTVLEELVKFPSSFSLSPSLIKLTQAFWLIDNKEFQAGLLVLLDPLVNPSDITLEQHRRIIKTFLYQGYESQALTYIQIRKPPIHELEDIRLNLTVLLANGKIREAFHFQRKHRVMTNAQQLLTHFFLGCEELERLESIVHLPLTPEEEESFVSYLSSSHHPSAQDILLIYYIQKSRYTEITSLLGPSCKNSVTQGCRIKHNARSAIVQGYISHLPYVRAHHNVLPKERPSRKIYLKPKPLSARIRQGSSALKTPKSKSSMSALHLTPSSSKCSFTPYTPFRSKAQRRKAITSWNEDMGLHKNMQSSMETQIERTQRVFPSFCKDAETYSCLTPPNTLKAIQVETPLSKIDRTKEIALLQESVSKLMENVLKKSLYLPESSLHDNAMKASLGNLSISQDVISLLKTPIKHHNRVGSDTLFSSLTETPQGILKVRKILENTQDFILNEDSSPIVSFPRCRMSLKKDSASKLDISVENHSLTPKQLRFDLSATRKLSVEEEEEETTLLRSLQKKRKRASPPLQSTSEVPSPRKPLPRFVNTGETIQLDVEFTSNVEENSTPGNGIREKEIINRHSSCIDESNLQSDAKRNSQISSKSQESNNNLYMLKKTDAFKELSQSSENHDYSLSSSEGSVMEDSFHSVLDNQEVMMKLDHEKSPSVQQFKDVSYNKDEENSHHQSYSYSDMCGKRNELEKSSPVNSPVNQELKSISEQKKTPVRKNEIHTSITVTTTKIVKETYSVSSQEETAICSIESQSENKDVSKSSDFSAIGEPYSNNSNKYSESNTETNQNACNNFGKMSPNLEISINKCHSELYLEEDNSMPFKENSVENITNVRVDEKVSRICTQAAENKENILSDSDENLLVDSDKNKSLDENYILKFSDSEDENTRSECFITDKENEEQILDISKQDTLPINNANISNSLVNSVIASCKCDTILNMNKDLDSQEKENDMGLNTSNPLKSLPSDLENAQPLRLTTKEREIVDIMLKNSSLSLNHIYPFLSNTKAPTSVPIFGCSEEPSRIKESIVTEKDNYVQNDNQACPKNRPSSPSVSGNVTSKVEDKEYKVNTINNNEDREIFPHSDVIDNSSNLCSEKIQESVQIPDYFIEINPDNNNIQIDSPPTKDIKLPHTPSRKRSRCLSGLNPESIIDPETPATPLRRSMRLNTPSKSLTAGDRRKTKEGSNTEENDIHVKNISFDRRRRRSSSGVSNASDAESIDLNLESLAVPSRRRRTRSDISETEIPIISRTPNLSRDKGEDSNPNNTKIIIPENLHDLSKTPTKPVAANIEMRLSGFVKEENETEINIINESQFSKQDLSSQSEEYSNTPVKHVDTPRRRSARLSGIKEILETIVEDKVESKTPRKSATGKSTPTKKVGTPTTRSKRKSVSQSSSVVEPLETIKEDSELSSGNFSLPHPKDKILIPPLSSSNPPTTSDIVKKDKESELSSLNETTPVDLQSLKNSVSNSLEFVNFSKISNFIGDETNITPDRNTRVESEKDHTVVNSNNILLESHHPKISLDKRDVSDRQLPSTINKKSPKPSFIGETDTNLEEENLNESDVSSQKYEYTFISPEESSKTISIFKSYPEKKTNATLRSSRNSRPSWRRSRTTLSLPKGFEFPENESSHLISNIARNNTVDSLSPVQAPHSFILNNDDVFFTEECKTSEGTPFDIINDGSPAPIYHLFKGDKDVIILPKKPSKPKTKISYHRGVTSLKSYNSDDIIGRKSEDDNENRAYKKLRSSTLQSDLSDKRRSSSMLKGDVKGQEHLKGFLFQNPEIMSASEAVSEVFEKLTKEHERIVSENFVFSPPFSFSENRRKKRRKVSRNSKK